MSRISEHIEELQAENERLRAVLVTIAHHADLPVWLQKEIDDVMPAPEGTEP